MSKKKVEARPRSVRGRSPRTLAEFIEDNRVFRFEEAVAALKGKTTAASIAVGLNYHVGKKHLARLRRGLYCRDPESIEPLLVASRITHDAVIAYTSALKFHLGGEPGHELQLLTEERFTPFKLHGVELRGIRLDKHRLSRELEHHPNAHGIVEVEHLGTRLRVVSRERALVDCLDRLDLGVGLEELTHTFFGQRGLHPDALFRHAQANRSAVCAARLGMLMECHQQLSAAHSTIGALRKLIPKNPAVFDPANKRGLLVPAWNAIVPMWFLELRGHRLDEPVKLHRG